MTKSDLAKLAEFAGGKVWWSHESGGQPSEPGWLFEQLKPAWPVIMQKDWQPHKDPAHGWLVLRALAKRDESWFYVLSLLSKVALENEAKFDLWPAVCRLVLELKKDGD